MEMVAVGSRWDTAGAPLPPVGPPADRPSFGAELALCGDLWVDPDRDWVAAEVADLVAEDRWLAAMAARYDRRLADAYLRGAAEFAARCGAPSERERRELGARQMLAELAVGLRVPEATLAHRLTRITMLGAFPRLVAAAEAGRISPRHCDVVLDAFAGVADAGVLARADEFLADRATRMTAPELRASARGWRSRHVPRTPEQREVNLADRHVRITPADEDMMWLVAKVPAAAGVAIDERLDTLADRVCREPGETRSRQQIRADALVDLLLDPAVGEVLAVAQAPRPVAAAPSGPAGSSDTSEDRNATGDGTVTGDEDTPDWHPVPGWVRGLRPEVVLTVPVLSLLGHGDEPAELEGFGPVDLDTAAMLCAQAPSFLRVLTDPHTGAVLGIGRDRYRLPADLKRAVRLRDVTCRFPGCRRRARACDVDHSTAWERGGASDLCNLACLCRRHHRLKHEFDWQITHQPGGILEWTAPTGHAYTTEPGTLWPPPPPPPPPGPPRTDSPAASQPGCPEVPPF